jgi:hypothetical protein
MSKWLPYCKNCKRVANEFWDGLCANCNPALAERQKLRKVEEQYKRDLYWALRTRVLTLEEMKEVEIYDYTLLTFEGQSYYEKDIKTEFNETLLRQFKMRLAAERETKA